MTLPLTRKAIGEAVKLGQRLNLRLDRWPAPPPAPGGAFIPSRSHPAPSRRSALRELLARRTIVLSGKDGHPHVARPITASDAPALMRCYDALTDRAKWFRVLHRLPHLSEDMARDYCTPDPVHDLCVVLEGVGLLEGEILGGARIAGYADGMSAEYSVTLRPEAEGLGLAHQALELVFAAAKEMGYARVWGMIHAENSPMLNLAKSLHMTVHRDPNDAGMMISERLL